MSNGPLDRALEGAGSPLRGMSGLARALAGVAVAVLVLAITAWRLRVAGDGAPAWVLGGWVLMAGSLVVGVMAARRAIRTLGPWHIARRLEATGGWRRGSLTTVLDPIAAGTSSALHVAAATEAAAGVDARGTEALRPAVQTQARRTRLAAVVATGGLLALVAAGPLRGSAAGIWHPVHAWRAMVAPVRLQTRSTSVARGERATFELVAYGQRRAILLTRAPGERWQAHEVALDASGQATYVTPPLAAEIVARLEAGGRQSPEVRVAVRLPAFLGAFKVTAVYPAYLRLESEPLPTGGDTLVIPEGTRLKVTGQATTPLASVEMAGPLTATALQVTGSAFSGEIVPLASGSWLLRATTRSGALLEGDAPRLPIRVLPDSTPFVEVPVPGADTVAPPSLRVPLVVAARDDHGLRGLTLEVRRGARGVVTRIVLPIEGGDRALATHGLDLSTLTARPGDTVYYVASATDNAPVSHTGRSREYRIRIPTEQEQRIARDAATAEASAGLDSVAAAAKRAQRQAEDLARERQRGTGRGSGDGDREPMSLEAARKAEAAARAEEQVIKQASELARKVEELRQAAAREGLADSALARQLGEIQALLDKAISPELRQRLAALRDAAKDLDADRTKDALQELAKRQAELSAALEQARELFKRAALETELSNLSQQAKELADAQAKVTKELAKPDSAKAASSAERALAARADALAAAIDRAGTKVPSEATKQGLQQAGERARKAGQKMQQAASSAEQGKPQQAEQEGKEAAAQLEPLDEELDAERQRMQESMRKEVLDALERTLAETSRLAQRQEALAEAFRRGAVVSQSRIDQGTVEEGAGKLMQQVTALAAKNALIPPRAGVALAAARVSMRAAVEAVSSASPNLHEAADQAGDAVDALAVTAYSLLRAKQQVSGSKSGSGLQEAMEQMQQMAGKQGQLNQQASGMMQQGQGGAQQMLQMAMQQRAIAQQLERMRSGGQVPGAGELAREAKDLARALETGRLNRETADRQERLFKKMLDAGRSLQGEEQDETKERQSQTAKAGGARLPDPLDPRLRDNDLRLPGWDQLQRLSPEERRRVIDYFRRLAGGGQ
ncbi:MAG: hypothetical protein ABJC19_04940 [Gemmatimonadota bacterium]